MSEIITAEEAARLRGVTGETIRRWCRDGWLTKARKAGKTWLLDKAELMAFEPPKPGPVTEGVGDDS